MASDNRMFALEKDVSAMRTDLAAVRGFIDGAFNEFTTECRERFDKIIENQETANGRLLKHDIWIAAKEPICRIQNDDLSLIKSLVYDHQDFVAANKESIQTVTAMANAVKNHEDYIAEKKGLAKASGFVLRLAERLLFAVLGAASFYLAYLAHITASSKLGTK